MACQPSACARAFPAGVPPENNTPSPVTVVGMTGGCSRWPASGNARRRSSAAGAPVEQPRGHVHARPDLVVLPRQQQQGRVDALGGNLGVDRMVGEAGCVGRAELQRPAAGPASQTVHYRVRHRLGEQLVAPHGRPRQRRAAQRPRRGILWAPPIPWRLPDDAARGDRHHRAARRLVERGECGQHPFRADRRRQHGEVAGLHGRLGHRCADAGGEVLEGHLVQPGWQPGPVEVAQHGGDVAVRGEQPGGRQHVPHTLGAGHEHDRGAPPVRGLRRTERDGPEPVPGALGGDCAGGRPPAHDLARPNVVLVDPHLVAEQVGWGGEHGGVAVPAAAVGHEAHRPPRRAGVVERLLGTAHGPDRSARSGVVDRQARPAMSVTSTTSCTVASGAVPVMRTEGTSSAGPSTGSTMSSTLPSTLGVQPPEGEASPGAASLPGLRRAVQRGGVGCRWVGVVGQVACVVSDGGSAVRDRHVSLHRYRGFDAPVGGRSRGDAPHADCTR